MPISSARLSPNGKMMATAATRGGQRITVQEIPSGLEIIRLQGHKHLVTDVAFSPDERTLISGSVDGTMRLWDLTPAPKETESRPFSSDLDWIAGRLSPAFSLSPDGRHLLTIFTNGTFSVWETPSLKESPRHQLPVGKAATAALAAGGQLAAFVTANGNVVLWHGSTEETNWLANVSTDSIGRAAFSLDGKRLAIGGGLGSVSLWDVPSGKNLYTFPTDGGAMLSLGFTPDGQMLMAGFFSGLIKIWDFTKPSPEITLRGHDWQVKGLALLPDGRTVVSASHDIRFWDLKSQTTRMILNPRPTTFCAVAISADGRRIAIGANDGLITIWDLASNQEVATLTGPNRPVLGLSFLPDGNSLVSLAVNEVRVWRAATLQEADAESAAEPQSNTPR